MKTTKMTPWSKHSHITQVSFDFQAEKLSAEQKSKI